MTEIQGPVRVRFAPSPTGFLHVGGARTAIYNDLLRQSVGGAFILRIEDTDKERSDEAMTRQIQSALAWIGVVWDEGPFLQSERLPRHHERAEELLAAGKAYRCFCTPEELDAQRAEAEKRGVAFRYPRTCLSLSREEIEERLAAGKPFAVRFQMPDEHITFTDIVRGDMDFPPDALDDFILLRSDGNPTYHMSVVCDDIDMRVTHVIRGEDHLSNTPKHIPLFRALGGAGADLRPPAADPRGRTRSASPSASAPPRSRSSATRGSCRRRSTTSWRCSAGTRATTGRSSRATR